MILLRLIPRVFLRTVTDFSGYITSCRTRRCAGRWGTKGRARSAIWWTGKEPTAVNSTRQLFDTVTPSSTLPTPPTLLDARQGRKGGGEGAELKGKLCGCRQNMEKTVDFLLASGLQVQTARPKKAERKRRRKNQQ